MPNKKPIMMNAGHSDDLQTPAWALEPLLPFLPKDAVIWESACGKGNLVDRLIAEGYKVKWSDILRDPMEDFFKFTPKKGFDIQVTNPPFSIKDLWIRRSYELMKPWALLLPYTALGGQKRQAMYRAWGLQVIFFDKRVDFEVPSGKHDPWFGVAWFTWHLDLPSDILFVEVKNG